MDTLVKLEESDLGLQQCPMLVIVERHILMRTCLLDILKRELAGFEIVEMTRASDLLRVSRRDIRLIALDIGDGLIDDPAIENDLRMIHESFPDTPLVLLANRDDEFSVLAAMRRGVRGFIPTSLPVQVAIAGLRLVLAGSVYRPFPIDTGQDVSSSLETRLSRVRSLGQLDAQITIDLTPREAEVLAVLELGLSNKLIAAKLKLSENTVKMHMRHIMRKFCARNRTEVATSGYNSRIHRRGC
jgi:DNA-binding NarL/FixJ family response regulator